MSVTMSAAPPDLKKAFLEGLDDYIWTEPELAATVRTGAEAIQGIPVYTITLQELQDQKPLTEAARPAGWRLFFRAANEALAGDVRSQNGVPRMTSLSRGQKLAAAFDSVLGILSRPEVSGKKRFELRLLRIPGVSVEGVWLRSAAKSQGGDLFIPIITGMKELNRDEAYTMTEFLRMARDVARQSLEFDKVKRG